MKKDENLLMNVPCCLIAASEHITHFGCMVPPVNFLVCLRNIQMSRLSDKGRIPVEPHNKCHLCLLIDKGKCLF